MSKLFSPSLTRRKEPPNSMATVLIVGGTSAMVAFRGKTLTAEVLDQDETNPVTAGESLFLLEHPRGKFHVKRSGFSWYANPLENWLKKGLKANVAVEYFLRKNRKWSPLITGSDGKLLISTYPPGLGTYEQPDTTVIPVPVDPDPPAELNDGEILIWVPAAFGGMLSAKYPGMTVVTSDTTGRLWRFTFGAMTEIPFTWTGYFNFRGVDRYGLSSAPEDPAVFSGSQLSRPVQFGGTAFRGYLNDGAPLENWYRKNGVVKYQKTMGTVGLDALAYAAIQTPLSGLTLLDILYYEAFDLAYSSNGMYLVAFSRYRWGRQDYELTQKIPLA